MSSTVKSYGFVAVLAEPLHKDVLDDVREQLEDAKSDLHVNYEGTLIYSDLNTNESYDTKEEIYGINIGAQTNLGDFATELAKFHYQIDADTAQPYSCIWYNGADNPMDTLTLAEFNEMTEE